MCLKPLRVLLTSVLMMLAMFQYGQTDSVYYGNPNYKSKSTDNRSHFISHMTFGGNFQVWLGNPTFMVITPNVGYNVVPHLNVGVGGVYSFLSYSDGYNKVKQSIFGGSSYVRYDFLESYFLQLQYDKLRQPLDINGDQKRYKWIDYLFVGGGFRNRIGTNAYLLSYIMYNLTPSPYSIYGGRFLIQIGFSVGL